MTTKIHVETALLRLMAAFPTFKMPALTQTLYVEKLQDLDADDFGNAIEFYLEKGGKFPAIGLIRAKGQEIGHARRRAQEQRASEDQRRTESARVDWGPRFGGAAFTEAFNRGRNRMLDHRRGDPCPCMNCEYEREQRSIR